MHLLSNVSGILVDDFRSDIDAIQIQVQNLQSLVDAYKSSYESDISSISGVLINLLNQTASINTTVAELEGQGIWL